MIYDQKVIQRNVVKYGKTAQVIEYLKHSDRSCLIARNKAEKAKLVKRFNLSPNVSKRILVEENNTVEFPNGSHVYEEKLDQEFDDSLFVTIKAGKVLSGKICVCLSRLSRR